MKQLQKNLLTNVLCLVTNVIVGIFYTPYLVKTLGVIAYGVVPLTLIINQYINVLTGSLSGALTRFYSIALQQKDYVRASKCISTVLGVFGLLVLFLFPLVVLFVRHVDSFFTIPESLVASAKFLFLFTICSFFISLFASLLNVTLYAENRLDWMNWIKIVRIGMKFLLTIIFFQFVGKEVHYIGLANLLTELFILGLSYYLFKTFRAKTVLLKIRLFDKALLFSISGMAIWTIIHQLGDVGLYRVDNVIVNNAFGMAYSGALGAVSEFGVYVSLMISVIGSLYGPIILKAYAQGDHDSVQRLVTDNSLIVGTLSAILCGILMGTSDILLSNWLGDSFASYDDWLVLKLLPLPFFAAAGVYAFSNRAWNVVRYPAIITIVMGVINLCVLWILARGYMKFNNNVLHIVSLMLLISAFIIIAQSFALNAFFFLRKYPQKKRVVMQIFWKIILVILLSWTGAQLLTSLCHPSDIFQLFLFYLILAVILLLLVYGFVYDKEQKRSLMNLIRK